MDHYTRLLSHIRQSVVLSAADETHIRRSFQLRRIARKGFVLQRGDVSHHVRFVAEGCLRNYYLDEDGKEHILQFAIEEWWTNDMYSYLTRTPARYFIEALEPSVVLQIHRDTLEVLFRESPVMERFFRLKTEGGLVATQDRMMQKMSQSAEERYLHFRQRYRLIEQRIPQYMVASYLGITPEFLSALRKKMSALPLS